MVAGRAQNTNVTIKVKDGQGIPACFYWTVDEVATWIESIGFGKYKDIFKAHSMNGQKLLTVDCCMLPKMGITHFGDVLAIKLKVTSLLDMHKEYVKWPVPPPIQTAVETMPDHLRSQTFRHRHEVHFALKDIVRDAKRKLAESEEGPNQQLFQRRNTVIPQGLLTHIEAPDATVTVARNIVSNIAALKHRV